jgi:hypothetical protein
MMGEYIAKSILSGTAHVVWGMYNKLVHDGAATNVQLVHDGAATTVHTCVGG